MAVDTPSRASRPARKVGETVSDLTVAQDYGKNVIFHSQQGHGVAAELGNHRIDQILGRDAVHEGADNKLNGADRRVNGVAIQTKYCRTAADTVNACFDGEGVLRYKDMQIEVPKGQYDEAVDCLTKKLGSRRKAVRLIREGHLTYEQSLNLAKAGTIESLTFDASTGAVVASQAGSVTALATFALAVWQGESVDDALDRACVAGLTVAGTAFLTSVAVNQLAKTGFEQAIRPATTLLVDQLGSATAKWLVKNLSTSGGARQLSGAAAKNHLGKLVRGNVAVAVVTTVVLSAADIGRLFSGRISGAQAFKNIATTGAGVAAGLAGGSVGSSYGAAIGSAIPGAGTVVGAAIGWVGGALVGAIAGAAGSAATNAVLGAFIEDDAVAMATIVNQEFAPLAQEFLLSAAEVEAVLDALQRGPLGKQLRDMFASDDRPRHARQFILLPLIEEQVRRRPRVAPPAHQAWWDKLTAVISDLRLEHQRITRAKWQAHLSAALRWGAIAGAVAFAAHQWQLRSPLTSSASKPPEMPVAAPQAIEQEAKRTLPEVTPPPAALPAPGNAAPLATPDGADEIADAVALSALFGAAEPVGSTSPLFPNRTLPFVLQRTELDLTDGSRLLLITGIGITGQAGLVTYRSRGRGWLPGVVAPGLFQDGGAGRFPIGSPQAYRLLRSTADEVTIAVHLDSERADGQSSRAMYRFIDLSLKRSEAAWLPPSFLKSADDGTMAPPVLLDWSSRTAVAVRETNPRFDVTYVIALHDWKISCKKFHGADAVARENSDTCAQQGLQIRP